MITSFHFTRIEADTDRSLFFEGSHEADKALFAHYRSRLTYEILW